MSGLDFDFTSFGQPQSSQHTVKPESVPSKKIDFDDFQEFAPQTGSSSAFELDFEGADRMFIGCSLLIHFQLSNLI